MDYNLQKWIDAELYVSDESNAEPPPYLKISVSKPSDVAEVCDSDSSNAWAAGFEGLVVGIFTSSLLYQHPIGIVPMTNYGDLLETVPEVRALHLISKEILNINYAEFGVSGSDRSWENVLKQGVAALRARIENLYETYQIVLSPSDLMALIEDANHGVLTLLSPHAKRRLPVQGLFIDIPKDKRDSAIKKWAKDLISVMVDCMEIKKAQKLKADIWTAYNDDALVEDRKNLSLLARKKEAGECFDEDKYKQLCDKFSVIKDVAKGCCVDIKSTGDYSNRERRWAALLITLEMLKTLVLIQKKFNKLHLEDHIDFNLPGPELTADDLFLALFPVPAGAIILPWHSEENLSDSGTTWPSNMLNWKTNGYKGKQRNGDLALNIYHLLNGENWQLNKTYGLTDSERIILQGFAVDNPDNPDNPDHPDYLEKMNWLACNIAKRVLWGKEGVQPVRRAPISREDALHE